MKRISIILLSAVLLLATSCGFIIIDQPLVDIPYWAGGSWKSNANPIADVYISEDNIIIEYPTEPYADDFNLRDLLSFEGYYIESQGYLDDDSWQLNLRYLHNSSDFIRITLKEMNQPDFKLMLEIYSSDYYSDYHETETLHLTR